MCVLERDLAEASGRLLCHIAAYAAVRSTTSLPSRTPTRAAAGAEGEKVTRRMSARRGAHGVARVSRLRESLGCDTTLLAPKASRSIKFAGGGARKDTKKLRQRVS